MKLECGLRFTDDMDKNKIYALLPSVYFAKGLAISKGKLSKGFVFTIWWLNTAVDFAFVNEVDFETLKPKQAA